MKRIIRPLCAYCREPLAYPAERQQYHKECRKKKERASNTAASWKYKQAYERYKTDRGCLICGYNKTAAALDFHHKDPALKTGGIGERFRSMSSKEALEEISQCVLLCKNCHAEQHWGESKHCGFSVYLAARFSRQTELKKYAKQLDTLGISVTSSWLHEDTPLDIGLNDLSDDENRQHAQQDWEDIERCDCLVLFTENPEEGFVRGGRHFEFGLAYGFGKLTITVGPKENIFHYLENIPNFERWAPAKVHLLRYYIDMHRKENPPPKWIADQIKD